MLKPDYSNAPDQDVVNLASRGDESAQRELREPLGHWLDP